MRWPELPNLLMSATREVAGTERVAGCLCPSCEMRKLRSERQVLDGDVLKFGAEVEGRVHRRTSLAMRRMRARRAGLIST